MKAYMVVSTAYEYNDNYMEELEGMNFESVAYKSREKAEGALLKAKRNAITEETKYGGKDWLYPLLGYDGENVPEAEFARLKHLVTHDANGNPTLGLDAHQFLSARYNGQDMTDEQVEAFYNMFPFYNYRIEEIEVKDA